MAANIFGRYIWLVDTLLRYKKLTYEELNALWKKSNLSYGDKDDLPLRTFHNHRAAIKDIFDVYINCDTKDHYRYYIDRPEDIVNDSLRDWLVSSYSVLNQLQADKALRGRIIFEEVPSGQVWLTAITDAMHRNKILRITHKGFEAEEESSFNVEPYCLKMFHRRWYLIARSPYLSEKKEKDIYRSYALDRISYIEETDETFALKEDVNVNELFAGCCGVTISDKPIERIIIKAYDLQPDYLRTLPLHSSQKELESNDNYTLFEYHLRPTFDFYQQLLSQADLVEVLEPESVREQMVTYAKNLLAYYGKE